MRQESGSLTGVAVALPDAPSDAPEATKARARLGYVDSLRALAALYVVAHHIMLEIWLGHTPQGIASALVPLFLYGHVGVSVFIVLSGFSLMLPVARNHSHIPWGVWGFYRRRARRILPPYYFAMGLSLALIWLAIGQKTGTLWDDSLPVTIQGVLEHIFLIQDFSAANDLTINFVLWSIALECQIYLLFPALLPLWRRYSPLFAASLVLVCSFVFLIALLPTWIGKLPGYALYSLAPQYLGLFAMGMFAASIHRSSDSHWSRLRDWGMWDVIALGASLIVARFITVNNAFALDPIIGLGTVGLLLASSRRGRVNPIRAALEWRPLVWIGGFSYSLYLIHAPLIQLIWQYGLRPLGLTGLPAFLALLLLGGPLIVAAAWVFWYGCERPFLNSRPAALRWGRAGAAQIIG